MATAKKARADGIDDEKVLRKKKKEFRDLKERHKALQDLIKKSIDERKELETRINRMAVELGIELKGKKFAGAGA